MYEMVWNTPGKIRAGLVAGAVVASIIVTRLFLGSDPDAGFVAPFVFLIVLVPLVLLAVLISMHLSAPLPQIKPPVPHRKALLVSIVLGSLLLWAIFIKHFTGLFG